MTPTRREVFAAAAAAAAFGQARATERSTSWEKIAAQYNVTREIIQLENGNWGIMARPVLVAYERAVEMVNRRNSFYARREFGRDYAQIRARVAATLGVGTDEIVFTRNATEALQALIGGYNRLKPGDHVLYADLDYDSMQTAMDWLEIRRGVTVIRIALPELATHQNLIDAYEQALKNDPKIRLVLLTHIGHRTGLMIPVREIAAMARARGVDVIVDAAHSWGQANFTAPELSADFIGFNLHKWIGAPLGVGLLYIRKERIADIDPFMAGREAAQEGIASRVHTGTVDFAALLTVPEALDFHAAIGPSTIEARLRHLRALWAEALRDHPGIEILTPEDKRLSVGITSFRLKNRTTTDENIAIAKALLEKHRIFTVHRTGITKGACVRVTPALFNSEEDVLSLRRALTGLAAG